MIRRYCDNSIDKQHDVNDDIYSTNDDYKILLKKKKKKKKDDEEEERRKYSYDMSRRTMLSSQSNAAAVAAAVWGATTVMMGSTKSAAAAAVEEDEYVSMYGMWSAVDGLNSDNGKAVSFDPSAYKAMKDDPSRTPLFQKAIYNRLYSDPTKPPEQQIVLDLGTGPYALFAIIAAEAGAGKVYAIEANADAARLARQLVTKMGYNDIITIVEGVSTDIEQLPNGDKADFVVAEIVGSIASEEGAVATIQDAQRFVNEPNQPSSWIPNRIQTYAAPASYTLHNLFAPPDFDWTKLNGTPVRFNCRDQGLQLLSNPTLVEDIPFYNLNKTTTNANKQKYHHHQDITFIVNGDRLEHNEKELLKEFINGRVDINEAKRRAYDTSRSVSGIAFWPRLILQDAIDTEDKLSAIEVNSREYATGGHQRSHWQTVLPIMSPRPVEGLMSGDKIHVSLDFLTPNAINESPKYTVHAKVYNKNHTNTPS